MTADTSLVDRQKFDAPMNRPRPRISIIVPARNEGRFIASCISSLRRLDTNGEAPEIIVVDNKSTDDTAKIAKNHGLKVLTQEKGLVGSVRNRGARESTGEVLAFIDADCVAPVTWLSAALKCLEDEEVGIVGGHYLPNPQGTWVERTWAPPSPPPPPIKSKSLPGGSMILRRRVFERVGGFDEELSAGEDDALCRSIADLGLRVAAVPECYVIHLGFPATLRDVVRRQIWHGASQLDVTPSVFDGQLVLTHAFALGVGVLAVGLVLVSIPLIGVALMLLGTPLMVLSVRKAHGRDQVVGTLLKAVPIAGCFYLGRAIGLARNYGRLLRSRLVRRSN